MLQGTGSDVGKSLLVAGLCRLAANRGIAVMPFKPQNMSNNAAVAVEGGEIGRAQWLQALACRQPPSVHMNPVLLKPESDQSAQLVVQGQVAGRLHASAFQAEHHRRFGAICDSFERLRAGATLVIVEGAGGPAETNLRARDMANMGFARPFDIPVILVGDIDRGGVIASLVGTHAVMEQGDRAQVRGFVINKFRGDLALFAPGLREIENRTGWPGLGVVPWLAPARRLPAEDAVVLDRAAARARDGLLIAVPMLSRIANFDDLDPLAAEAGVTVRMVPPGAPLPGDADLVVLPGTKATRADLDFFRAQGWDVDLRAHARRGGRILGLCGGYQMLGRSVRDPDGHEGPPGESAGLGYLEVDTVIGRVKTVREVPARPATGGPELAGFEMHMGETSGADTARPAYLVAGRPHGAVSADGHVAGCYLHGLFAADSYRRHYLAGFGIAAGGTGYHAGLDTALDEISLALEDALDVAAFFRVAGISETAPGGPSLTPPASASTAAPRP